MEAFSHSTFSTLHAYYLNILNSLAALVRMNGRDSREGSSEPRRSKGILQTSNRKGGMEKVRSKQAIRRSHTRNEAFASAMTGAGGCPATAGGVPWKDFIAGLRSCARSKNLGTGASKSREYRMRFNKYLKAPRV